MSLTTIKKMLRSGKVTFHKVPIGGDLPGFVYSSRKDKFHIFVDNTLAPDAETDVILHECGHIIRHAQSATYTIGLDGRNRDREKEAEQFVRECKEEYATFAEAIRQIDEALTNDPRVAGVLAGNKKAP